MCEMCGSDNPASTATSKPTTSQTIASPTSKFNLEQLTDCVYKIVEDDRYSTYSTRTRSSRARAHTLFSACM